MQLAEFSFKVKCLAEFFRLGSSYWSYLVGILGINLIYLYMYTYRVERLFQSIQKMKININSHIHIYIFIFKHL